MTDHSVLILYKHRLLGWRFNQYLVEPGEKDTLQIVGPPGRNYPWKALTDDQKKLLQLLEDSSDKSLMKKYSKEKTVVDFMKNLSEEKRTTYIRPAIELYSARIVQLVRSIGMHVYLREDMKRTTLYPEQRIYVPEGDARCVFHFVKDDRGLRYFISLTHGDGEVSLLNKPDITVVNKPAIVVSDNRLHVVEDIEAKRLRPFFTKAFISVPANMEQQYMHGFVLKTFLQYQTKMQGIVVDRMSPVKKALLFLEEDINHRLCLLLHFLYGTNKMNPASKRKTVAWVDEHDIFRIHCYDRDMEWERGLVGRLLSLGMMREGDNFFYLHEQEDTLGLIGWMNKHHADLSDFELTQNTGKIYHIEDVMLRSAYSKEIDWFELHIEVVAGRFVIPFVRFRRHILTFSREYILPDKSILVLPSEWFVRYGDLFLHGENHGDQIRLKKHHFGLVESIFEEKEADEPPAWQKEGAIRMPPVETSTYCLRPYQQAGLRWLLYLHANRFGGCLADDMGLGKTLQTIVLLQAIYQASPGEKNAAGKGRKKAQGGSLQLSLFGDDDAAASVQEPEMKSDLPASLVIVPTSLLHNWENEIHRFAPGLKVYIYAGSTRLRTRDIGKIFGHYHLVITSYGTVRNDLEYLAAYRFHYLILDESQYIKNAGSQTYKAVKQLEASYRLALTGTPIENSLSDLWAQFNFINEGLLGSYSSFQQAYMQPIAKGENEEAEYRLQRLIRPFLLRRTKDEVAPELPPVTQRIVYCDMTESQQEVYSKEKNRLRNNFLDVEKEIRKNKLIALQGLMRLRLLANHPTLVMPAYRDDSGKFEQILLSFETLRSSGHKVLIFSSFVKHLKLIAAEFDKRDWKYTMLTGNTRDRKEVIDRFMNDPEVSCFFISLKAGGVGLNLTAADYVFIVDPWWNPAAEMQALSRAHRIGQEKNVILYRFISSNTIEEKILKLQEKKTELSATFITSGNILDSLTEEELKSLFG